MNTEDNKLFSLTQYGGCDINKEGDEESVATEVSEYDIEPENFASLRRPRVPPVKDRYFGVEARLKFFDRMNFINRQRNICQYSRKQPTNQLFFDNEDHEHRDFPYSLPVLPPINSDSDQSVTSSITSCSSGFRSKYLDEFPEPTPLPAIKLSPRSKFISNCLKEEMNPRASLILRKKLGKSIDLQHLTIGNKIAIMLSKSLGDMPYVDSLNINNNNLTDEGVSAILNSIKSISSLKSLNLSRNKMDNKSAESLANYVKSKDCPLETLVLQQSDIDDFEGERFVRDLYENCSITDLDLSENKIGQAENMRTIIPNLVTCSEALANLLMSPSCNLARLNLSWNAIRMQSSIRLSCSLAMNSSLIYLNLSYNSFGVEGGEQLGSALMENHTLETLLLVNNSLNSTACFTIAVAAVESVSLRHIVLDSNPIGEGGSQAVLAASMSGMIQIGS